VNVSATHTICNMENHKMLNCQNCALTVAIFTVSIAIALSTSPTQAQVPVSKFTFDSPATLGDDSGSLNNDATGNIGSPTFSPTGVVGGSLMLDGSSAIIIPDAQDYNFASGFTVAAFVNIDPSNNDSARIFSRAMGEALRLIPGAWEFVTTKACLQPPTASSILMNRPTPPCPPANFTMWPIWWIRLPVKLTSISMAFLSTLTPILPDSPLPLVVHLRSEP